VYVTHAFREYRLSDSCGDLRGLLENLIGMQLRLNLYKGVGADKLSADVVEQEKELATRTA